MKRILYILTIVLLHVSTAAAQNNIPEKADPSMFRAGYDLPAGIPHGTWDFDEWPGVDHNVVYKRDYMYNSFPTEKIKIDYFLSLFDKDDHEGYLKQPEVLRQRGFVDMHDLFTARKGTLLGVFGHPDDDILLAGGLLAHAAANGWNVRAVIVSNGANGGNGSKETPSDLVDGFNAIGVMADGRVVVNTDITAEQKRDVIRNYSDALGVQISVLDIDATVNGRRLRQFGEVPGLDFPRTIGPGTQMRGVLQTRIAALVADVKPDMIITHGTDGEYGNYLHKAVREMVLGAVRDGDSKPEVYSGMPEYNFKDKISHFIDLDRDNAAARNKKWEAIKRLSFLYGPGKDYDKPWDPNDTLMDGEFVKDYGMDPVTAFPPRYEFFSRISY